MNTDRHFGFQEKHELPHFEEEFLYVAISQKNLFSLQNNHLNLEEDLTGVPTQTTVSPANRGAAEQGLPL